MNKITLTLLVLMQFFAISIFAQTKTIILKPGADIGKDANIFYRSSFDSENKNYGSSRDLTPTCWTWSGNVGIMRSLIEFTELNKIPSNAIILSAELKFYGVSESNFLKDGNGYYEPEAPYSENSLFLERIISKWDENTVTWNTKPKTTIQNQVTIPASKSQWNWNYTVSSPEFVSMLQEMISYGNYGFMLRLKNEECYRTIMFASSDNPNPKLWPELKVTYKLCKSGFTFSANTDNLLEYKFIANHSKAKHKWFIDGKLVSTAFKFSHVFELGTHKVCHVIEEECEKCISICVGGDLPSEKNSEVNILEKEDYILKEEVMPVLAL